jgi:hypothetical protein
MHTHKLKIEQGKSYHSDSNNSNEAIIMRRENRNMNALNVIIMKKIPI